MDTMIWKAKKAFKNFLERYEDKEHVSFKLKVTHTYHVAEKAKEIAEKLNLSKEDVKLAELIGILHDIGRFEELKITKELNSVKFNHAMHGSKMLFEEGMIKEFIEDRQYDEKIEAIFPTKVRKKEDMEESLISDKVYETVLNKKCVDIHDRITPLDFLVCILAFTFDLNFDVSYKIIEENITPIYQCDC